MKDGKMFAMFFNASPCKGWNTAKMLEAAKAGAEEAGAETELVNLYDISRQTTCRTRNCTLTAR